MSMRELGAAVGLNVGTLYHYFPSKRDLLEAVLTERGYEPIAGGSADSVDDLSREDMLANLLTEILGSVIEVEDFVRLMVGETIRGEQTARAIGSDLFSSFQGSVEEWLVEHRPDLNERSGAPEVARLLRAMIVGIFVEHAAGVMCQEGEDPLAAVTTRAREAAQILSAPGTHSSPR